MLEIRHKRYLSVSPRKQIGWNIFSNQGDVCSSTGFYLLSKHLSLKMFQTRLGISYQYTFHLLAFLNKSSFLEFFTNVYILKTHLYVTPLEKYWICHKNFQTLIINILIVTFTSCAQCCLNHIHTENLTFNTLR